MRRTENAALALKRLATAMGWTVSSGNALRRNSDGLEWQGKKPLRQLAQLTALAQRTAEGRAAAAKIAWRGKVPLDGISDWEADVLRWLREQ